MLLFFRLWTGIQISKHFLILYALVNSEKCKAVTQPLQMPGKQLRYAFFHSDRLKGSDAKVKPVIRQNR